MKLTVAQQAVLLALAQAPNQTSCAYDLGCTMNTLNALESKKCVRGIGLGHIAFPRSANWRITPTGKRAVQDGGD